MERAAEEWAGLRQALKRVYRSAGSAAPPKRGAEPPKLPAENVRLDVLESETVLREQLNERAQLVVAEDALACSGLVKILYINDAVQPRALAGDGADGVGQQLAECGGLLLQIRPARAGRNIEADEFVVLVNEAGAGAEALEVVLVNVGEALEEDERKDVVLELGRVNGAADDAGGFPKPGFES